MLKKHSYIYIMLIAFASVTQSWAQAVEAIDTNKLTINALDSSSLVINDTIQQRNWFKRYWSDGYPSPKKALTLSLLLPGAGQVYNKRGWWWRVPVIYGGLGFGVNRIIFNTDKYKFYRDLYVNKINKPTGFVDPFPRLDREGTRRIRDGYDKQMQQWWFFTFIWYLLNSADAFVNAHLNDFDIDDNLSQIRLQAPSYHQEAPSLGIGVGIQF